MVIYFSAMSASWFKQDGNTFPNLNSLSPYLDYVVFCVFDVKHLKENEGKAILFTADSFVNEKIPWNVWK